MELTAAQKAREAKHSKVSGGNTPNTETVSMSEILDLGCNVTICGTDYEIKEFSLKGTAKAAKFFPLVPELWVMHGLAAEGGQLSLAKTTAMINKRAKIADPESAEITEADTESTLAFGTTSELTEEQADAMVSMTLLSVAKCHPEATGDDLEDMTVDEFLDVLAVIFRVNPHLRARF